MYSKLAEQIIAKSQLDITGDDFTYVKNLLIDYYTRQQTNPIELRDAIKEAQPDECKDRIEELLIEDDGRSHTSGTDGTITSAITQKSDIIEQNQSLVVVPKEPDMSGTDGTVINLNSNYLSKGEASIVNDGTIGTTPLRYVAHDGTVNDNRLYEQEEDMCSSSDVILPSETGSRSQSESRGSRYEYKPVRREPKEKKAAGELKIGLPESIRNPEYISFNIWHNTTPKPGFSEWSAQVLSGRVPDEIDFKAAEDYGEKFFKPKAMDENWLFFSAKPIDFRKSLIDFVKNGKLTDEEASRIKEQTYPPDIDLDTKCALLCYRHYINGTHVPKGHNTRHATYFADYWATLKIENGRPVKLALHIGADCYPLVIDKFHDLAKSDRKNDAPAFTCQYDPLGYYPIHMQNKKAKKMNAIQQKNLTHHNPANGLMNLLNNFRQDILSDQERRLKMIFDEILHQNETVNTINKRLIEQNAIIIDLQNQLKQQKDNK